VVPEHFIKAGSMHDEEKKMQLSLAQSQAMARTPCAVIIGVSLHLKAKVTTTTGGGGEHRSIPVASPAFPPPCLKKRDSCLHVTQALTAPPPTHTRTLELASSHYK
jgi:hypothetical protein